MNDLINMTQVESAAPGASSTYSANSASPIDGNMSDSIQQLLTANDNRPGIMYEDVSSIFEQNAPQAAPPQQPQYQAPAPQQQYTQQNYERSVPDPSIVNALQYERARNEELSQKAQYLSAIEEFLAADPVAAERAIQYLNTGVVDPNTSAPPQAANDPAYPYLQQAQQTASQRPQAPVVPPVVRQQLKELKEEILLMRLKNEDEELQRMYPGVYQTAPVVQYMAQHKFSSMRDAFHHLLGQSVGELMKAQQMQQYQQQVQAWQQYHQQQQYAPQHAENQYQTQYPVTSTTPPPSAQDAAVVLRPGAGLMAPDPMDNVKPKNWREVNALVSHDMRRLGFQV